MDRIIFLANRSTLESSMTLDLRIQSVRKRAVNLQEVPGVELGHAASASQGGLGVSREREGMERGRGRTLRTPNSGPGT